MTLDKAAKRHANSGWKMCDGTQEAVIDDKKWASFISGANWQLEKHSKELRALRNIMATMASANQDNVIGSAFYYIRQLQSYRDWENIKK